MAFTTIRIKNSNVAGKVPAAGDLDVAELCINLKDKKLFTKDVDGNIFELGQTGVPGDGGDPPASGDEVGDLWWDGDNLLVWNGSEWEIVGAVTSVNGEAGDVVLTLNDIDDVDVDGVTDQQVLVYDLASGKWKAVSAASLTVDVDLGYTAAADGGTVTNSAGDDATIPMANGSTAGLSLNDFTTAEKDKLDGIDLTDYLQKGDDISELTNDAEYVAKGDNVSELTNDAGYLTEVPVNPPSDTAPGTPSHGDLWVDTSACPPVLKIYVDEAECPGEGGWQEIEGGGAPKPIDPKPDDGNNSITPKPPGSGTEVSPYILTASSVNAGNGTTSVETISFSNGSPGDPVIFVDQNAADNGERFTQAIGITQLDGTYSTKLSFSDAPKTDPDDKDYTGLLKIGTIYYSWTVSVQATVPTPIITQSPVISSSTGETTTPITVDTRAAVTNATFTSSAWLKDGAIIPGATSTSGYTPTAPGKYRFREVFTGDDASTVNANSNELEITVDQTKPSATMSGLRFDSARNAHLSRGFSSAGNQTTATISFWFKRGAVGTTQYIYGSSSAQTTIVLNTANQLTGNLRGTVGTNYSWATASTFADTSAWHHVVVAWDSSQAVDLNRVKIYVDGVEQALATAQYCPQNNPLFTNDTRHVGTHGIGISHFDGYLSDVYFVDGEVLEPTVFGKSFEGKWGPLDSDKVLENIKGKTKSPYEERPNMNEKWSNDLSGDASSTAPLAFDGEIANRAYGPSGTGSTLTWLNSHNVSGSVWRLYIYVGNSNTVTNTYQADSGTVYNGWEEKEKWSSGLYAWVTIKDAPTVPGAISIKATAAGGSPYLAAIEVDGRILVDGPADMSQNWSDGNTNVAPDVLDNAFDGDLTTQCYSDGSADAFFTISDIPATKVECYGFTSDGTFYVDGSSRQEVSCASGWVEIYSGSEITVNKLGFTRDGAQGGGHSAWRINDKILIDAGAQWDQSQVWSDGLEAVTGRILNSTDAFDGNTDGLTKAEGELNSIMKFTFPSDVDGVIKVYAAADPTAQCTIELSDGTSQTSGASGYAPVTFSGVSGITSLTIQRSGAVTALAAIELNGAILVDPGSLGSNGFYLPFDPAQTGANYSLDLVSSPDFDAGEGADLAFNGDLSSAAYTSNTSAVLTFTPSGGIDVAEKLEWYVKTSSDSPNAFISINGSQLPIQPVQSMTGWLDLEWTGTIDEFIFNGNGQANGVFYGLRVDGEVLVDHNSIGVDASGNGNHFQDQNFAVGNTSQIWSDDLTSSGSFNPIYPPTAGFDGDLTTNAQAAATGEILSLANTFNNVLSMRVKFRKNGTVPEYPITMTGTGFQDVTAQGSLGNSESDQWQPVVLTSNTVSGIQIQGQSTTGASLCALEINGELLVDKNIKDTVLDTPMKNYAVLTKGENGNLVTTAVNPNSVECSINVPSDSKVYAEFTFAAGTSSTICFAPSAAISLTNSGSYVGVAPNGGGMTYTVGDIIGIALDTASNTFESYVNGVLADTFTISSPPSEYNLYSSDGNTNCTSVNNFGQQPFAYTPPAGYDGLFQTWEQYARTALGYTQDQLAEATKKLAAQEPYVQLMRALIREWQPGVTYGYGDIVQLNGMTYQAEANDVRLIAPDAASADGSILWRPLVQVAPPKKLERPKPEEPTVLPAPDEDVDFAPGVSGGSISTMPIEEGPSDEEPPKKTTRRRKKS